jgi:hypothetical protein
MDAMEHLGVRHLEELPQYIEFRKHFDALKAAQGGTSPQIV